MRIFLRAARDEGGTEARDARRNDLPCHRAHPLGRDGGGIGEVHPEVSVDLDVDEARGQDVAAAVGDFGGGGGGCCCTCVWLEQLDDGALVGIDQQIHSTQTIAVLPVLVCSLAWVEDGKPTVGKVHQVRHGWALWLAHFFCCLSFTASIGLED